MIEKGGGNHDFRGCILYPCRLTLLTHVNGEEAEMSDEDKKMRIVKLGCVTILGVMVVTMVAGMIKMNNQQDSSQDQNIETQREPTPDPTPETDESEKKLPEDKKKISQNGEEKEKKAADEESSDKPVVQAEASIRAGGQVDFHGWSVDFQDAFRSQRNGDETAQSGHTFLTVPYKLKNEAPSTRDDPMSSLVIFAEGGRKYENRNATGRAEHAATVRADESTVQWQTFEIPNSVVESAFYVAFQAGSNDYPFKMKVSPSDVKNP
jgi:hypothetical protein